ncbi:MAG: dihydrofolate synthase [Propionibacteriaceae bacterium]|jgi:dihydrofolate synthase/folylpolyglutamate synthase|nr:dihydrofolate synthase [Propionibacteriaceae bacterium]
MTDPTASSSTRHAQVLASLLARWPEHRVAPSLGRIAPLMELLGEPQRSAPVVHITGTNGKGSTAIVIDALLRAQGLRTGRYSSPHLVDVRERIAIDGEPISAERFDDLAEEIAPLVALIDERLIDGVKVTFFEYLTAMAYAAFADAPVDVMIVEVGLGGAWDATNVADGAVSVVTPISLDHTHLLGDTLTAIAQEKAGIIKPGGRAVLAGQEQEAAAVLVARAVEAGAQVTVEGVDFALLDRQIAVGGQVIRLETAGGGPIGDLHLPLHGASMAHNAVLAVAAVEAFNGGRGLDPAVVQDGFDAVVAPARSELVHSGPPVVIDTAHNPAAVASTVATIREAYSFSPLIAVWAMMADKDARGSLELLEPDVATLIVTTLDTPRARPAEELGDLAREIFGPERVVVVPHVADAIDRAIMTADLAGIGAGILVAGSVILAGQARDLLLRRRDEEI